MAVTPFHSLFSRIGLITILVVSVAMLSLGLFYTARFSSAIDLALEERIQLPGALMNRQVLRYDTVASKELMTELVGDEFVDGVVVGADGHVYYAFQPEMVGMPYLEENAPFFFQLAPELRSPVIMASETDSENYLTCLTPIVAFHGADPFFYSLITIRTTTSEEAKQDILFLFLLGSVLCVLLTSATIMAFTRKFIIRPVEELETSATRLAKGDLDQEIKIGRTGELASLARSFSAMREAIRENIRELEHKEKRLNAVVNALPDVVLVQDASGMFLEVYTSNEAMLYEQVQQLMGKRTDELFPPDKAETFMHFLRETVDTGRSQTLEYELEVSAGTLWFEGRSSLIQADGDEQPQIVVVARDITSRKQMEESLRQAKDEAEDLAGKLLEMDATKTSFLSSVSHELRTPLTSLLGFAKLIRKEFTNHFLPLSSEDHKLAKRAGRIESNLEVIVQEGERLTRLITNVLDLDRMETGRMQWNDELLEPEEVIAHAFRVAEGQFALKPEVAFRKDMEPGLPKVVVDPDRLHQVLINLMDNAAKHTDKGSVTLRAGREPDGNLFIEVKDTGVGIARDQLDAIFEKYQQSGAKDTIRTRSGTGLGLAICREIVHNYGGDIRVESRVGSGSSFRLVIPATQEKAVSMSPGGRN